MTYTFGTRSKKNLETVHPDLVKIMNLAISWSPTDFGIHAGGRTVNQQLEYFDDGKSKINPKSFRSTEALAKKAKHVTAPNTKYSLSRAVDFHISETVPGKNLTWDRTHMAIVIGVILSAGKYLYEKGEVKYKIRSGGDWNTDGVFIYDQNFLDMPHIEMIGYN